MINNGCGNHESPKRITCYKPVGNFKAVGDILGDVLAIYDEAISHGIAVDDSLLKRGYSNFFDLNKEVFYEEWRY